MNYRPSDPAIEPLLGYLAASPSPYHAAVNAQALLSDAGLPVDSDGERCAQGAASVLTVRRDGTLLVAAWPTDGVQLDRLRFVVLGAHTDSPNLRVRPQPEVAKHGYRQLAVEPYGGVLWNSWLDRDLGLAGTLTLRSGERRLVALDEPLLVVPQLAIHLDRDVNTSGLTLNPQQHLTPVWGLDGSTEGDLRELLADRCGVAASDIVSWNLMTFDITPPTVSGANGEFYSSGRIDNLTSCWATAEAFAQVATATANGSAGALGADTVAVLALFDHEEIGSTSDVGAAGALAAQFIETAALATGADRAQFLAALARSTCASVDGAHAINPNYADRYEPGHHVRLGGGPVIKHNANVRYATSPTTSARFIAACQRAGVPTQHYSHSASIPCGSTIGPLTAAGLAIATVDVGAAQLAMHSARETAGTSDPPMLRDALVEFVRLEPPS